MDNRWTMSESELEKLGGFRIVNNPVMKWKWAPTGDFFQCSVLGEKAPCWFHRLMQRLFFGFRYERIDDSTK
jgi:hypothetical protein